MEQTSIESPKLLTGVQLLFFLQVNKNSIEIPLFEIRLLETDVLSHG